MEEVRNQQDLLQLGACHLLEFIGTNTSGENLQVKIFSTFKVVWTIGNIMSCSITGSIWNEKPETRLLLIMTTDFTSIDLIARFPPFLAGSIHFFQPRSSGVKVSILKCFIFQQVHQCNQSTSELWKLQFCRQWSQEKFSPSLSPLLSISTLSWSTVLQSSRWVWSTFIIVTIQVQSPSPSTKSNSKVQSSSPSPMSK